MIPVRPLLGMVMFAALSFLPVLGVCPVSAAVQETEAPEDSPPTPIEVFAGLETFWKEGEADSLIVRLSPDEIRLSFHRIGPRDGNFDCSQAKYLLADLFEFARTDSFLFTRYKYDPSGDDPPRAVGHWYYKGSGGIDREARVIIDLTPLNGSWAISSIEARKW
ncbi:MAG: hypothetical protein KAW17_13515 [Candidatus Eisenbacteria sp.]|nr:hypothetical protein [Candidatus Eisenbacteria bacterium]